MREPRILEAVRCEGEDEHDYVEFVRAGASGSGSFECTACGHRIMLVGELPVCRVCGERLWEHSAWRPFAEAVRELRRTRSSSPK